MIKIDFGCQHILLKLCFVLLTFVVVFVSNTIEIGYLIILNIVFFIPDFKINLYFLKTVIKLSYFLIAYILSGIVLNIPFYVQIEFLLKVIIMIQLSVFLLKTIRLDNFMNDTKVLLKYTLFQQMIYFVLFFNHIFQYIGDYYDNVELAKMPTSKQYFSRILQTIKSMFENIDTIRAGLPVIDVDSIRNQKYRPILTLANGYLLLLIMIYLLAFLLISFS